MNFVKVFLGFFLILAIFLPVAQAASTTTSSKMLLEKKTIPVYKTGKTTLYIPVPYGSTSFKCESSNSKLKITCARDEIDSGLLKAQIWGAQKGTATVHILNAINPGSSEYYEIQAVPGTELEARFTAATIDLWDSEISRLAGKLMSVAKNDFGTYSVFLSIDQANNNEVKLEDLENQLAGLLILRRVAAGASWDDYYATNPNSANKIEVKKSIKEVLDECNGDNLAQQVKDWENAQKSKDAPQILTGVKLTAGQGGSKSITVTLNDIDYFVGARVFDASKPSGVEAFLAVLGSMFNQGDIQFPEKSEDEIVSNLRARTGWDAQAFKVDPRLFYRTEVIETVPGRFRVRFNELLSLFLDYDYSQKNKPFINLIESDQELWKRLEKAGITKTEWDASKEANKKIIADALTQLLAKQPACLYYQKVKKVGSTGNNLMDYYYTMAWISIGKGSTDRSITALREARKNWAVMLAEEENKARSKNKDFTADEADLLSAKLKVADFLLKSNALSDWIAAANSYAYVAGAAQAAGIDSTNYWKDGAPSQDAIEGVEAALLDDNGKLADQSTDYGKAKAKEYADFKANYVQIKSATATLTPAQITEAGDSLDRYAQFLKIQGSAETGFENAKKKIENRKGVTSIPVAPCIAHTVDGVVSFIPMIVLLSQTPLGLQKAVNFGFIAIGGTSLLAQELMSDGQPALAKYALVLDNPKASEEEKLSALNGLCENLFNTAFLVSGSRGLQKEGLQREAKQVELQEVGSKPRISKIMDFVIAKASTTKFYRFVQNELLNKRLAALLRDPTVVGYSSSAKLPNIKGVEVFSWEPTGKGAPEGNFDFQRASLSRFSTPQAVSLLNANTQIGQNAIATILARALSRPVTTNLAIARGEPVIVRFEPRRLFVNELAKLGGTPESHTGGVSLSVIEAREIPLNGGQGRKINAARTLVISPPAGQLSLEPTWLANAQRLAKTGNFPEIFLITSVELAGGKTMQVALASVPAGKGKLLVPASIFTGSRKTEAWHTQMGYMDAMVWLAGVIEYLQNAQELKNAGIITDADLTAAFFSTNFKYGIAWPTLDDVLIVTGGSPNAVARAYYANAQKLSSANTGPGYQLYSRFKPPENMPRASDQLVMFTPDLLGDPSTSESQSMMHAYFNGIRAAFREIVGGIKVTETRDGKPVEVDAATQFFREFIYQAQGGIADLAQKNVDKKPNFVQGRLNDLLEHEYTLETMGDKPKVPQTLLVVDPVGVNAAKAAAEKIAGAKVGEVIEINPGTIYVEALNKRSSGDVGTGGVGSVVSTINPLNSPRSYYVFYPSPNDILWFIMSQKRLIPGAAWENFQGAVAGLRVVKFGQDASSLSIQAQAYFSSSFPVGINTIAAKYQTGKYNYGKALFDMFFKDCNEKGINKVWLQFLQSEERVIGVWGQKFFAQGAKENAFEIKRIDVVGSETWGSADYYYLVATKKGITMSDLVNEIKREKQRGGITVTVKEASEERNYAKIELSVQ